MLSFLSYFGASSSFEKHRLLLTTKNYEAPDQTSLKKIIETFRGQDEQTRAQIAFATILKKIHTSDSNDNWVYLLKNLIIFDRVVQENCFLEQIASLNLKPIENYQQKHDNAKALNSQNILKSYWKLIQYKSCLLSQKSYPKGMQYMHMLNPNDIKSKRDNSFSKNLNSAAQTKITPPKKVSIMIGKQQNNECYDSERSILSVLRSQKHQFLKTLSIQQIYKQALQLETLFVSIFKSTLVKPINKKSNILSKENQEIDSSGLSVNRARDNSKKQQVASPLLENLLAKNSNSQVREQSSKSRQKFKSVREQFYNSRLANYIHLQLLYKLICTYTNQLFCIKMFVSHLLQQTIGTNLGSAQTLKSSKVLSNQTMSQVEINQWKKIIANYLSYSQKIITYVEKHKTIKGFQLINYSQLSPFQNANIFSILDDFIEHKNTFLQPEIVKVQELGSIMGGINNQIKVQRKAQWSYEKALTARKMVFPSRNLKDKNTPFSNWHNSYSSSFPPKQILTLDLIMQMRQNPHNPATETSFQDDEDQSIYQPFIVNRHSCIYNYRQSNISMVSQCQFIPVEEMKKKDQEKLQSAVSQKTKSFYYFRYPQREKRFQNIYSKISKENGTVWIK